MNNFVYNKNFTSMKLLLVVTLFVSPFLQAHGQEQDPCGDPTWLPFEDSKCYRLVEEFASWSQASIMCGTISGQKPATLATIKSADQQKFVENLVFNRTDNFNDVWIGASRNSSTEDFFWDRNSDLQEPLAYTNWGEGSPSTEDGRNCVQMVSGLSRQGTGTWKDTACAKGNFFLCEKLQQWTINEVQEALLKLRKELENARVDIEQDGREIENLKNNPPVPIGFLYTELSGQPAPASLWPQHTWTDVTANYAGLFFRAVGGNAGAFGAVQDQSSPRLTNVQSELTSSYGWGYQVTPGQWSGNLHTGDGVASGTNTVTRFLVSNAETRPRNMAVRIWKRTA